MLVSWLPMLPTRGLGNWIITNSQVGWGMVQLRVASPPLEPESPIRSQHSVLLALRACVLIYHTRTATRMAEGGGDSSFDTWLVDKLDALGLDAEVRSCTLCAHPCDEKRFKLAGRMML